MRTKLIAGGNGYNVEVTKPNRCDICGHQHEVGDSIFDARTHQGQWANMCETCYSVFGVCLGIGCGQQYEVIDLDETT